MGSKFLALLSMACVCSGSLVRGPDDSSTFELVILHNNDMHARFEQTSQLSGTCTAADRDAGKCYGGFARVAHVVKEARAAANRGEAPPVLYLNAGDTYTGTAWFTIYKWRIAAELINALKPDAVSLGNVELRQGANQLPPYLEALDTAILSSNVILHSDKNDKIRKSTIFDVEGTKVGVVGFLTPDNKLLDKAGNIEYIDELIAMKEEVQTLQSDNVNIIIALGHSSLDKSLEIAHEIDGIDIVITGHKNVFYWNGSTAETINKDPFTVTQKSGRKIPVFQSFAYNNVLGKISIYFDNNGEITNFSYNPILLDNSIPSAPDALAVIKNMASKVRADEVIGETAVVLDGSSCNEGECNLGNLITDAMMFIYAVNYEGEGWTDAPIAIIHSGAICGSIAPAIRPASITTSDLMSILPRESTIVAVSMTGTVLKKVLEHSISDLSSSEQFLQFSGIRVAYDLSREPGARVVSAVVRCGECLVPEFFPINEVETYKVLMPVSLANGDYGFDMLVGSPREDINRDEISVTADYIKLRSPVYPDVAGRIEIEGTEATEITTTIAPEEEITTAEPDSATAVASTLGILSISLGNHEFDDGIDGLVPFVHHVNCPILAANLDLTQEPTLKNPSNLIPSVIIEVSPGVNAGIIGYLTPDTKVLAVRNNVEYIDEVIAIRAEINFLKQENVTILIALGHSGFDTDLRIAREVEDIDLVIGGHTNTFLWNGPDPDTEKVEGPYPTIVKQASGRIVPVVQAYAYTKYLGSLNLIFDKNGELVKYDGNPILLDNSIPRDPEVLAIVKHYEAAVAKIGSVIVGNTSVVLDARRCRLHECNLGNLIADAMVYNYASKFEGVDGTDGPIAIIQGGGIRASIVPRNLPANITREDLFSVMPFDSDMVKMAVNGSVIWDMLEHSVASYNFKRPPGQFLQMSGMTVEYDFSKKPGQRVIKATALCNTCNRTTYLPIDGSKMYNILMPSFLSGGGDGFAMLQDLPSTHLPFNELDSTVVYLGSHSPITKSEMEGRIRINNLDHIKSNADIPKIPNLLILTFILYSFKST